MTALDQFSLSLIEDDTCPRCLGELDTGYECNKCNYDANVLLRRASDEFIEGIYGYFEGLM